MGGDPADAPTDAPRRRGRRGQALVEFALVVPIFFVILGSIIQAGLIVWGKNTLQQIVNDTGRWAATQCPVSASTVSATANQIAAQSSLVGYSGALPIGAPVYSATLILSGAGQNCPPTSNATPLYVTITITNYQVPMLIPNEILPAGAGQISASAQFRVEQAP